MEIMQTGNLNVICTIKQAANKKEQDLLEEVLWKDCIPLI